MSDPGSALWLLALEQRSRQQGSAIGAQDLVGHWQLVDLWDRQARPQTAQARLLRGLRAQLTIETGASTTASPGQCPPHAALALRNSVSVGAVDLSFEGPGWLQGRRPLLRFHFEALQLRLGRWRLWHQRLPAPSERGEPFFALIGTGRDQQGRWLLARGRGGGLARWRCS
jgi:hypothetical protein